MTFRKKKSLGQHFLIDKNIVFKIIDAIDAKATDRVIEIGPGTGALTKWLAEKYDDVHAIELDERAVEYLKKEFPSLNIHQKDILQVNWGKFAGAETNTFVVGNLPYYITSPILFDLLEHRDLLSGAILMMQKEVAERLVAEHSSKQYGILSVQTQLFSSVELLFDVSRNSFSPPPKVTSSVIRLRFNKQALSCSDASIKKVVRTAFNQRRKKLSNSLKPVLGDYLPEGFNFNERAEHWEPATYAKLAEHLEESDKLA
ncbi:MAG: 16S rRNA (adenine(1518)-N(6)/adenine(1519)-N(6))-dimethyltransferase RsmA [Balneolaceae bacterium]